MPARSTQPSPAWPEHLITPDATRLKLRHWAAAPEAGALRGVICLVHGLGEHSGRHEALALHLCAQGWAVLAHDLRGHGSSGGARGALPDPEALLRDLAQLIDLARAHYPGQRLLLLGHSMGGLIVARFVAAQARLPQDPGLAPAWSRPVEGLVLSSPALDLGMNAVQRALLATVAPLLPNLALSNGLKPEWVCSDPGVVRAYVNDPLVHDRITGRLTQFLADSVKAVFHGAAHWPVSTLLLYAGADRCICPAGSVRFADITRAAQRPVAVKAYPRMAHEIFHEPDQDQPLAELDRWLAAL